MDKLILWACALVFFSLGYRWYKMGSPYKRGGGDAYTRRSRQRTIGLMSLVTSGVLVILGLVNTYYSGAPPAGEVAAGASNNLPPMAQPIIKHTGNAFSPDLPAAKSSQYSLLAAANITSSSSAPALLPPPPPPDNTLTQSLESPSRTLLPDAAGEKRPDAAMELSPTNHVAEPAPVPEAPPAAAPAPSPAPAPSLGPIKSDLVVYDPLDMAVLNQQLDALSAAIKSNPSNAIPCVQRGNIYGKQKKYDLARQDYAQALSLNPGLTAAKYNLAEVDFMEAKYDAARPVFASLQNDPDFGDLATYSVFLCDLAGGHADAAAKEFDAINQAGDNASYYFANVAWFLYHRKPDDARGWWDSATHIYSPDKLRLYQMPLAYIGYISTTNTPVE